MDFEKFLKDRDHTGRFVVLSSRTGKRYVVEPIGSPKTDWGDIDVTSPGKEVTGSYGKKYHGAIKEKDTMITEENGCVNIKVLTPGTSPLWAIEDMDAKYPDKENG